MDFAVLGPLVVSVDGQEQAVSGAKRRALLLRLLVQPNRVVPGERLIADLGNDGGTMTTATLHSHVSQLRRLLRPGQLVTRAPGYVLQVGESDLDASAFTAEVAAARPLVAEDPRAAADELERGLRRWRGPAFLDAADAPWAQAERTRLEELRIASLELLLDVRLALGDEIDVAALAEAAVRENPLRERLWAHLILALYRTGRQADALAAYHRLRRHLADELGLEPSPRLQNLQKQVLAQDTELLALAPAPWRGSGSSRGPSHDAARQLPLPAGLRMPRRFVGRREEQERLHALRAEAAQGRGSVVLLGGEAGVGKTALAARVAAAAHGDGWVVLHGRCDDALAAPYRPWVEALEHAAAWIPQGLLADHAAGHGRELSRVIPSLGRRLGGGHAAGSADPDTERFMIMSAVVKLITAIAAHQPLLLFLDDLHWADEASLLLLRQLAQPATAARLLVLGAFRDSELARNGLLTATLAALHREEDSARVRLTGLQPQEILELVEAAGLQPAAAVAATLTAETDGNPLFVTELLRHLAERPADALGGGMLPGNVREIVVSRIAALRADVRRVLNAAAVLGREFDLPDLACALDEDEEAVLALLEEALDAAVLVNPAGDRFSFTHWIVRQTLYAELPPARRRRLHRRAADAIATLGEAQERFAEHAHHCVEGMPGEDRTVRALVVAAEASARACAFGEAAERYEQALEHLQQRNVPLRASLLIELGLARRRGGDDSQGEHALREAVVLARELGSGQLLGRAALALVDQEMPVLALDVGALELLGEALDALGDVDSTLRVALLARLSVVLAGAAQTHELEAVTRTALDVAARVGGLQGRVSALNARLRALAAPESAGERLLVAQGLRAAAEDMRAYELRLAALHGEASAHLELGHPDAARAALAAYAEGARRISSAPAQLFAVHHGGCLAVAEGRFADADSFAEEAVARLRRTGELPAVGGRVMHLAVARWLQDRLVELADDVERIAAVLPEVYAGPERIFLAAGSGRGTEAREQLDDFLADPGLEAIPRNAVWPAAAFRLTVGCVHAGAVDHAGALFAWLWPLRGMHCVYEAFTYGGAYDYHLGCLAALQQDWDRAAGLLEGALTAHEAMRLPPWVAMTQHTLGRVLRRRGRRGEGARADRLLAAASATADTLGIVLPTERAVPSAG